MRTVIHIITGLNNGGAEAVLYRLIKGTPNVRHFVVSLSGQGKYGQMLRESGIEVVDLRMDSLYRMLIAPIRLALIICSKSPDAVQCWMYHANLVGGIAAKLARFDNVIWGIHNSSISYCDNRLRRYLIIRISAIFSRYFPKKIVSCSRTAYVNHLYIGYPEEHFYVVPNGHLVEKFIPDTNSREKIRREFSIKSDEIVLGMVARLDPQKDHNGLIEALKLLESKRAFKCLLVGSGLERNSRFSRFIEAQNLSDRIILAGPRDDIPQIMNAIDVFCLTSTTEAFSNVLCEAMACGTPCVATDVGDNAYIVENTGWIVPPRCPEKFVSALIEAIDTVPDPRRSFLARSRVLEKFSLNQMVIEYRKIWGC